MTRSIEIDIKLPWVYIAVLIDRHFPRGLCSNLIFLKCVSPSYSGQHQ